MKLKQLVLNEPHYNNNTKLPLRQYCIKNHTFKGKHRESTIKGPPDMPNQGTELYERVQYHATNFIKKKKDESLWSSPWCLIRTHHNYPLYYLINHSHNQLSRTPT